MPDINAAREAIQNKDCTQAIKILTDLIEQTHQEKTEQAFTLLIKAYRNCKQFGAAEATAVKALKLFPESTSIQSEYAFNAQSIKDWSLAIQRLDKMLSLENKPRPKTYARLVKAWRSAGEMEKAEEIALYSLQKCPKGAAIQHEYAHNARVMKNWPLAAERLQKLVEMQAKKPIEKYYILLVQAYRAAKDFDSADRAAWGGLEHFPDSASLKNELAINAEKSGNWHLALERLQMLAAYPELKTESRMLCARRKDKMLYKGRDLDFVMDLTLKILAEFKKEKIHYCVMRNFLFPQTHEIGSDIDIAVDYSQKERITEVFSRFGLTARETQSDWYFFLFNPTLQIWIFYDLHDGAAFMTKSLFTLMAKGGFESPDEISIPNAGHFWGLLFLREIFKPGSLKLRHLEQLEYLLEHGQEDDFQILACEFIRAHGAFEGTKYSPENIVADYKNKPETFWDNLQKYRDVAIKVKDSVNKSSFSPASIFQKPKGLLSIAIVGVDGAGKTTVIDNLKKIVPNKLPLIVMPMKAKTPQTWFGKNRKIRFHLMGKHIELRILGAFFDWIDKRIRYHRCSKDAAQKDAVILFERWTSDTTMAHHFKEQGHKKSLYLRFCYLLEWLMPKPDLFIYLQLTPELAMQRKSEDSPEVIDFRTKTYWQYYKKMDRIVQIDASLSQEEVAYQIEEIVFQNIQQQQHI